MARHGDICEETFILKKSSSPCLIEIEHGLKMEVRDFILEQLKAEPFIQEHFKLNIKRLNRWWYSVYFDKKE